MDRISKYNVVHRLEKRALLGAINVVAGIAIFYFGYDQGMMSGVNNAPNYYETMRFGHKNPADGSPVIDHTLLQGGIVSAYYLGTLCGALLGGALGDRFGRIRTIALACVWAILGASLQASAQNHNWMICARVVNGIGTGILNAITLVWATETSAFRSRGKFVAIEFTLNIFGVVVAYWIEYGCEFYKPKTSEFIWRFPVAFQTLPLFLVITLVWFLPESPRWLVRMGREDEARYILGRLRGEGGEDIGKAEAEFEDIRNVVELERKTAKRQNYLSMFLGIASGKLHIGRRVQLVIWLQIIQEWIGIAGITIYSPYIFRIAGISYANSQWVAGLNTITYMLSTLVCVFTLDLIGRRWTLYYGAVGMGICMFLAGAFAHLARESAGMQMRQYGGAAVFFVYFFTFIFGATWLTVPWLYPAEIFPLEVRAKGNAWGVVGWSIGNGWLTLICPVMFRAIEEKTLYVFGACNFVAVPIVWALYPETNQRTLEEMDLLFASDSIWTWEAERNFRILKERNPELVRAAGLGHAIVDPETGIPRLPISECKTRELRGYTLDARESKSHRSSSGSDKPAIFRGW